MKKTLYILIALMLVAAMMFTACGSKVDGSESSVGNTPVAKVGETVVTVREYQEYMEMVMYYYLNVDTLEGQDKETVEAIKADVLDVLILDAAHREKARLEGYYEFTPEQQEELDSVMEVERETYLEEARNIVSEEYPDLEDEEYDKKVEEAYEQYLIDNDIDMDYIYKTYKDYLAQQYYYDDLVSEVKVSDADVEAAYESKVEEDKATYSDQATFESITDTYGICYIPENARRVKHILVQIPDEILEEAQNAASEDEYKAKVQEGLDLIRPDAEAVLGMINDDGSNFDEIMHEYTEDPGIASKPDGYYVINGADTIWESNFAAAANGLENVGDMTGLVATAYGYHILRLEELLTPGVVPLEDVRESLEEELLVDAQETYYMEQRETWKQELGYEVFEEGQEIIDELYSVEE